MKYIFIILLLLCSCEKQHCWTCYIKERYIDTTTSEVINWYKYSITTCEMTETEIDFFEKRNTVILEKDRQIGTIVECERNGR